jgi:hypothetical protein
MEGAREKKLTEPEPVWQEGIGSLLLLAAAHQTGFLATLSATIQGVANSLLSSGLPRNLAVVERLMLTLLFLPVAGLARTWDLRTYTATMLALLTGRGCAYSYAYVEQFLSRLAHGGADKSLDFSGSTVDMGLVARRANRGGAGTGGAKGGVLRRWTPQSRLQ